MSLPFADLQSAMRRALALARLGRGHVEPNPMVGAVLVDDNLQLIAEGYHERFGGPHAEIAAISAAGPRAKGGTLIVTLEPCCHQGKTGPCTEAIIRAGIRRVVIATSDPFPSVNGKGIHALRSAGVIVETGLLAEEAKLLIAPFTKLVGSGRPWVHAKWAMTADGRIASRTGSSKWISGHASRDVVHRLRGLMDAIIIGSGTARQDDPLLTARPMGPRVPTRIVVDSKAALSVKSQIVRTLDQAPVLVACLDSAPENAVSSLRSQGVEVLQLPGVCAEPGTTECVDLGALMTELGRRQFTNVLVEGGSRLWGALFDLKLIDEAHIFVAPRIVGGAGAIAPIGGLGGSNIAEAATLNPVEMEFINGDLYMYGPVRYA
ncbi:MAG: bifunctional diaminohydroxyphosphoribosylaminopyrimidine deaminase/5-amino-6-(5-phosphoribosylamino)uracil reductase RibD [Planctomycetaceae bacterium]